MFRVVAGGLVALLGVLVMAVAAGAQSAQRPVVTAAAQVTTDPVPTRAHSSPTMARNPKTGELVILEGEIRYDGRCFAHVSADDGRSWFRGGSPMRKPFTDCALNADYGPYASTAFARDGTLYAAFVASQRRPPPSGGDAEGAGEDEPRTVFLARSTDSGRSFTTATVFRPPPGNADLGSNKAPTLAVDPTDASRVYVGWRQGEFMGKKKLRSAIATSGDGGRTFSAPVDISGKNGGDYPNMTVDSEGTLHATFWTRDFGVDESFVRPIVYRQSTDLGRTFAKPVQIDAGNQNSERVPQIATAPQPGTLYTVWANTRERKNGAEDFGQKKDIYFSRSTDGGQTWSPRRVINDDRNPDVDQSLPGISVASDGRLDIAWYDDRFNLGGFPPEDDDQPAEEEDPTAQNVFYTSSGDQGASFARNVRISDRHIDRTVGVWENNIFSAHNVAVDSSDEGVYIAWQDTRNADPENQAEDIYTAKLARSEAAAAGGGDDSNLLWALLGGGAALALGGLLLVGGVGWLRRAT